MEDDRKLPRQTVVDMCKNVASEPVKFTNSFCTAINDAVSCFLQELTNTANELCEKDKKSTITPHYMLQALKVNGNENIILKMLDLKSIDQFDSMKSKELNKIVTEKLNIKKKIKFSQLFKDEDPEEMMKEQQKIFEESKK